MASVSLLTCRCSSRRSCQLRSPRTWSERGSQRYGGQMKVPRSWRRGQLVGRGHWRRWRPSVGQGPGGWRWSLPARQGLRNWRRGLSAGCVGPGQPTPPQLLRRALTQVPWGAQGSPHLLEICGSFCLPLKMAFGAPAAHQQQLPRCLHPPTAGCSSGYGSRCVQLRPT